MTKPPEEGVVTPTGGMPEVSNKTMRSGKQLSGAIKLMVAALATVDSGHGTGGVLSTLPVLFLGPCLCSTDWETEAQFA